MGLLPPLLLSSPPGMVVSKGLFFIQGNLLASGASNSEIFIWDLNNLSVPMTPGSKSQVRRLPGLLLELWRQLEHRDVRLYHWRATKLHRLGAISRMIIGQSWGRVRVCGGWGLVVINCLRSFWEENEGEQGQ